MPRTRAKIAWFLAAGVLAFALACVSAGVPGTAAQSSSHDAGPGSDWRFYGHDAGGTRYSPLAQINRKNVANLKVAWTFHVGDISDGSGGRKRTGLETTPILVDGTLYLTSGFNRVFALDPETGAQRWVYDPQIDTAGRYGDGLINRGVAAWLDPTRAKEQPCRWRIFEATLDARLIALDSATGKPCADFGDAGQVSLRDVARYVPGFYHMTSPPAVIDDLVVVGSAIDDNARAEMSSGVVRAFDARTGALRWKWEPIPPNDAGPPTQGAEHVWRTGNDQPWRAHRHGRRAGIHRGNRHRSFVSRVRCGDRQGAVEVSTAFGRRRDSHDLPDAKRRQAVCGDRGWSASGRRRRSARRFDSRFCVAVNSIVVISIRCAKRRLPTTCSSFKQTLNTLPFGVARIRIS
ncbi:MAG TPA: PQQ-binding-like beta-propeller repeat protein [Candidatus Acidoferrales bacterium]|nr:PQQ-binding-like beta-propeller repeat protein [Candidatus Acidoferrales bacterium]